VREVWLVERVATLAALAAIIWGMVEFEELLELRWGLCALREADDDDEAELLVGIKSRLRSSVEVECCIGNERKDGEM
jgi:hypothetical protein